MSKRNGKNKLRLGRLDEINQIDRRMKKKKIRENQIELDKLQARRDLLRKQLSQQIMERKIVAELSNVSRKIDKMNTQLEEVLFKKNISSVDERMHDIDIMLEQWIGNSIIRKQLRDLIIKEITK